MSFVPQIQTGGYSDPASVEKGVGNRKYQGITEDCTRDVGSAQTTFRCLSMPRQAIKASVNLNKAFYWGLGEM